MVRKIFRALRKKRFTYEPLIEVLIHKNNTLHNLHTFQNKYSKLQIAPVLKSNAYGHGLLEIAEILKNEKIPFFCVDSYFEALTLKNEGIKTPILIFGYTPFENLEKSKLKNISFAILSLGELEIISKELKHPQSFHIEINTGMNRHGMKYERIEEAIKLIKSNKNIVLQGAYSHLAEADNPTSSLTQNQIKRWNESAKTIKNAFPNIKYLHLAATAGSFYSENIYANTLRIGMGLHGINTNPNEKLALLPSLELISRISYINEINLGSTVGYGATFEAREKMTIAAIPGGYFEGIDRRLSNKGTIQVRGILCPIIGRVSMNITSIDVSKIPDVKLNEKVVVISNKKGEKNSIEEIARICGTIPYEILVHIPPHLRRRIV